jgi:hypothetical protein
MFFEFREYRIKNGQRARWVEFMESTIIPFQISKGMVVVGSFVGEKEEDLYFWVRRFDSEAQREQLYKDVYETAEWQEKIKPLIDEMLDRSSIKVMRLEPTPKSVIR